MVGISGDRRCSRCFRRSVTAFPDRPLNQRGRPSSWAIDLGAGECQAHLEASVLVHHASTCALAHTANLRWIELARSEFITQSHIVVGCRSVAGRCMALDTLMSYKKPLAARGGILILLRPRHRDARRSIKRFDISGQRSNRVA